MTPKIPQPGSALLIVDVQKYFVHPGSAFVKFSEKQYPGVMNYITRRCNETVIPNIAKLQKFFRKHSLPVVFLRLCGKLQDRSDLLPAFCNAHQKALKAGFADMYPLENDPMAEICDEIKPLAHELVLNKTTYSGFTSTNLHSELTGRNIHTLYITGLATSQCVETTARDAADRRYKTILIEDALADYDSYLHEASLTASYHVCGGYIADTRKIVDVD